MKYTCNGYTWQAGNEMNKIKQNGNGMEGEGGDNPRVADVPPKDHSSSSKWLFTWPVFSIPQILGMFAHSMGKWKK